MFIYFCDICNKEFDRYSNYDRHLKSNLHHKKCIKIEESKEKSECKGCGCEFLKNSQNYFNHLKRNAFLEGKEYDFSFENKRYEFACNRYIEHIGNKFKHLGAVEAEAILTKYRMYKEIEGIKNIHKQKWAERVIIKEEDFINDDDQSTIYLDHDDLKKLEQIEDNLNNTGEIQHYYETNINGNNLLGSGYKHHYNNEMYYLYYDACTENPIAYEYISPVANTTHFYFPLCC